MKFRKQVTSEMEFELTFDDVAEFLVRYVDECRVSRFAIVVDNQHTRGIEVRHDIGELSCSRQITIEEIMRQISGTLVEQKVESNYLSVRRQWSEKHPSEWNAPESEAQP